MNVIELRIFGQPARISTDDQFVAGTISACYSAFLRQTRVLDETAIELTVLPGHSEAEWTVVHNRTTVCCSGLAHLIYVVEKTLTIELQHRRPDLFFLHAAALGVNGQCILIIGESGAGKSTLCWDLCSAGCRYMSDELAPVDLDKMLVEPYPHAICLKRVTEGMPALPKETIDAVSTLHIPVETIPGEIEQAPTAIDAIVFLQRTDDHDAPRLTRIRRSEAAARIYANGLNQLAHERDGLTAAARLAAAGRRFTLSRGRLSDMRTEVIRCVEK